MTALLMLAPVAVPLCGAVCYLTAGWRPVTAWLAPAGAALTLAAAVTLAGAQPGPRTAHDRAVRGGRTGHRPSLVGAVAGAGCAAGPPPARLQRWGRALSFGAATAMSRFGRG